MGSNAVSGAATGASAGAVFGPVGAVVGGVVGAIFGFGADKKAKEARKFMRKANALRTDTAMLRSFAEQRLLLRQGQLAQATGLAQGVASGAELESSGTQGVLSSVRNQMFDNFLLGQSILDEQLDANTFERKANAKQQQATDIMGMLDGLSSIASIIPQGKGKSASHFSGVSPASFGAFDTTLVTPGGIQTVNSGATYNG